MIGSREKISLDRTEKAYRCSDSVQPIRREMFLKMVEMVYLTTEFVSFGKVPQSRSSSRELRRFIPAQMEVHACLCLLDKLPQVG